ncbi:MAG: thiamine pyrophosphate-dependent enzyme [Acidobacteriota bacterium]|nr:thiamine pyrophosphate-dependent enzyme [Acidobacteriota bacterium]
MAVSRVQFVDKRFRDTIASMRGYFEIIPGKAAEPAWEGAPLSRADAVELFECQLSSRWIDFVARELKADGKSYYTIGSSGHEGNAMVGMLSRPTDTAFLHYRSGGFYFARARQVPGQTPIFDTCLSFCASTEDPISGGRHKVWGSKALNIPPQTSTIASHLPKAMGTAFFMDRRKIMNDKGSPLPDDTIVLCSFGDASVNHATALSGINAACWCAFQHLPMPVVFVCEDNGIGISVHTPSEWIESNYANRAGMKYFRADGLDFTKGYAQVKTAIDYCRTRRRPVFLHLKTVRLLGHAGSDVETTYHTKEEIEATEARDPLLRTAVRLIEHGILSPDEVLAMYDGMAAQVRAAGAEAARRPLHQTPESVMTSLTLSEEHAPPENWEPELLARRREELWKERPPEEQRPRHLAQHLNWCLQDLAFRYPGMALFGEDVAKKGGVYHVTADLYEKFGVGRVFNTLLDETTILGLAMGAGHAGLLPIPEVQYLAYLHNAIDQLRGEACSMQFFSNKQFANPMVVRIAGFAYQRGFGGHFHNDNSFSSLREIPGIIMVTASNGPDAVRLMRTCVHLAHREGRVVVFIEPIALYMTKDLVDKGDWSFEYPHPDETMPFGETHYHGDPDAETLVISYANGYYLSRQACADLEQEGIRTGVLELRFLTPLNDAAIVDAARGRKSVVIVDECRQTASLSEQIATILTENLEDDCPHVSRVTGHDTYIPLGSAWECVLPSRQSIYEAVKRRS